MFSPRKNKKHIFFAKIISDPIWACLALHSLNLIPLKVHFSFKFASVPAWGSRNFSNIIQIFSRDIHTYFKGLQWNCMISKGNVYQLKFFVAPKLDKVSKSSNSILRPLNRKRYFIQSLQARQFLQISNFGGWPVWGLGGWWLMVQSAQVWLIVWLSSRYDFASRKHHHQCPHHHKIWLCQPGC